jgi:hypothetical protein
VVICEDVPSRLASGAGVAFARGSGARHYATEGESRPITIKSLEIAAEPNMPMGPNMGRFANAYVFG